MKKILMLFVFIVSGLLGYDPSANYNNLEDYHFSNDADSVAIRNAQNAELTVPKSEEIYQDDTKANRTEADKSKDEVVKNEVVKNMTADEKQQVAHQSKYFLNNFVYADTGLYCPPLNASVVSTHIIVVDNIDFNAGTVTCNVFEKPFAYSNMTNELKNATPFPKLKKVETKTFSNPKYLKLLEEKGKDIPNNLIKPEAKEAAQILTQKMEILKETVNQKIKNNLNDSPNGAIYLNLSQIIDAVMVFDQSIIDVEASLKANDIVLKAPYVQSFKAAHIRQKVEENNKLLFDISTELNQKWDILPVYFDPKAPQSMEQKKSDAYQILGSGINKILFFIVHYYDILSWAVNIFLFGAILFALYNVSHYFFERVGNENERKNLKFKASITAITVITMLGITNTSVVYSEEGTIRKVELSLLQNAVGLLSRETNEITNTLAAAIIDSHSGGMFTMSIMTPAEVEKTAADRQKRELIREYQANHMPRCYNNFDVALLKSSNPTSYKTNGDFIFINENQLQTKTEEDKSIFSKFKSDFSPYNPVVNGGYVKNENWATASSSNIKYSLDACAKLEKDFHSNLLKLNLANRKIENFNDIEIQENHFQNKKAVMEKMWLQFQQYGYVALPLIAVSNVYEKAWSLPLKKSEEYLNLLNNFDMKESFKFISENLIFHYAIGAGIDEYSGDKYKIMTDALVGWIPWGIGQAISSFGAGAMGFITSIVFVDVVVEFIPEIRGLFIFGIATVMLFLTFIAKFVIFWGISFFIIYAFLTQSIEKTSRLMVKTILTFIKPAIILFVVFLSLFLMEMFHNVQLLFLDEMAITLSGAGGYFESMIGYTIKGIGHLFAIIIEFLVAFLLVTKGTNAIYAFFEQNTNDISDVVSEGLSQVVQNKVIK